MGSGLIRQGDTGFFFPRTSIFSNSNSIRDMLSLTSCFITLGAFHLLELTGQTNPVAMIISFLFKALQPDQSNPKKYARGKCFFSAKTLGKSLFHFKTDWSGHGPAGQF